jgi:hypothetical protein
MDAVAEFVGAMSKAWGKHFTSHFGVLFGSLQKYFKVGTLHTRARALSRAVTRFSRSLAHKARYGAKQK